jgi:hypothetical protein
MRSRSSRGICLPGLSAFWWEDAHQLAEISVDSFAMLDELVRDQGADNDALVYATDACVTDQLGLDRDMWRLIVDARTLLRDRRLARS